MKKRVKARNIILIVSQLSYFPTMYAWNRYCDSMVNISLGLIAFWFFPAFAIANFKVLLQDTVAMMEAKNDKR